MQERDNGQYDDAEGIHGLTRETASQISRKEQTEAMVGWFFAHFEDPAERTPYESAEGG